MTSGTVLDDAIAAVADGVRDGRLLPFHESEERHPHETWKILVGPKWWVDRRLDGYASRYPPAGYGTFPARRVRVGEYDALLVVRYNSCD